MKTLVILALVMAAYAATAGEPTAKDMGMTEEEHRNMHAIPPGTGASADGSGFLRAPLEGEYVLENARLAQFKTMPVKLVPNRLYRILPHEGALVWITPAGKREQVPREFLYPSQR